MTRDIITVTLSALAITVFAITMFGFVIPTIHAYEKANDYPFGHLCDTFNNCPETRQ